MLSYFESFRNIYWKFDLNWVFKIDRKVTIENTRKIVISSKRNSRQEVDRTRANRICAHACKLYTRSRFELSIGRFSQCLRYLFKLHRSFTRNTFRVASANVQWKPIVIVDINATQIYSSAYFHLQMDTFWKK